MTRFSIRRESVSQSLPASGQGRRGITTLSVQPGEPEPGFLKCVVELKRRAVTTLGGREIECGQEGSGDAYLSLRGGRRSHRMFPDLARVGRPAEMQERRRHPIAGRPISGDSTILSLKKETGGCIGMALLKQFTDGTGQAVAIGSIPARWRFGFTFNLCVNLLDVGTPAAGAIDGHSRLRAIDQHTNSEPRVPHPSNLKSTIKCHQGLQSPEGPVRHAGRKQKVACAEAGDRSQYPRVCSVQATSPSGPGPCSSRQSPTMSSARQWSD